jgi:hypothetical protein
MSPIAFCKTNTYFMRFYDVNNDAYADTTSSAYLLPNIGDQTICRIFMKFGARALHENFSMKRENWPSDGNTLHTGAHEFLLLSSKSVQCFG